ncbi:MAG: beta-ketoacyl synthase N-terminal-like domain-containing protein [Parahaliea sp.]
MTIRAAYSLSLPCEEGQGRADLKPDVSACCRERFRRIDRFTQLALVGSARLVSDLVACVKEDTERALAAASPLDPGTGLYLSSRFASLSNTIEVHERMVRSGDLPRPANFINTLSNAAGYYVARNLGLGGVNQFVSRDDASLLAALQLVQLDVASGQVSAALVGQVEEMPVPLDAHRLRLGVSADTALAEGSHWLWLEPQRSVAGAALGQLRSVVTVADEESLQRWLAAQDRDAWIFMPNGMENAPVAVSEFRPLPVVLPYSPAQSAAALVHYLEGNYAATLLVVIPDGTGRYHLLACTAS